LQHGHIDPKVVSNLRVVLKAFANGQLFGQVYGDGTPQILWLHGWGRSSADFAASAEILARGGVASVALDLPGFGASPLPPFVGGAREYADLLVPVVREIFGDSTPTVVGHSFGGRIATVMTARHPTMFSHLILTGAPLLAREGARRHSPWAYRAVKKLAALGLVSPARLERAKQQYGSADYRAATGQLRDILVATVGESYEAELALVTTPTTLVWGADDRDVPVTIARRSIDQMKVATNLVVLENVGHLVPVQAAELLASEVSKVIR
jgi:pimeloyl-ACP methyl ester carboxylesterase